MMKYIRGVYLLLSLFCFAVAFFSAQWMLWILVGLFPLFLLLAGPGSHAHTITLENGSFSKKLCAILVAIITIVVCIAPMSQLPIWNGENPGHRNQYELITEAFLDGRLDFAYGDEAALEVLENPYDPEQRKQANVPYHWDHAYYNGHYYMYFGVVPVFLAFMPYRLITGEALTTFRATQLFVAVFIAGIFTLFYMLSRRFFKRLPFAGYLGLSVAFSVMSVWYSSAEPALYCTAITAALALEIWSLYFLIRAVWQEQQENRQLLFAGIGALLGALVFGCRPPIALANILVLPILAVFLKQRRFTWRLLGKLALAALPYAVVAAGLMLYNNARFDNPFEFGQTYQLTVADQSNYRVNLDFPTLIRLANESIRNFFLFEGINANFPYFRTSSVFFNFPILLLSLALFRSDVCKKAKEHHLLPLLIGFPLTALIITAVDILWSPYLLERYRMDVYFLLAIGCFIILGLWSEVNKETHRKGFQTVLLLGSALTVLSSFLLYVQTLGVYYPNQVTAIAKQFLIG